MKKVITTGLAAGIAMLAVNMLIINPIFSKLFPYFQEVYENPVIFRAMDDPLMALFFLYPITLALAMAWVWDKVKHEFRGGVCQQATQVAVIYFFIAVVPMLCINFASFNLPPMMIISWAVMSVVNGFVGGAVLAKLNKA